MRRRNRERGAEGAPRGLALAPDVLATLRPERLGGLRRLDEGALHRVAPGVVRDLDEDHAQRPEGRSLQVVTLRVGDFFLKGGEREEEEEKREEMKRRNLAQAPSAETRSERVRRATSGREELKGRNAHRQWACASWARPGRPQDGACRGRWEGARARRGWRRKGKRGDARPCPLSPRRNEGVDLVTARLFSRQRGLERGEAPGAAWWKE